MPAPTRKKKRSSSKPPRKISPKRSKKCARAPAPKKRKKPAPKKRTSKRSAAAKKGWAKRRAKKRLLEKMADLKMNRDAQNQPLGWVERRGQLRLQNNKLWRQISVTYDKSIVDKRRLETLRELEIDLLTQNELYDYLRWTGELEGIEISDMYRMYLGYPLEGSLSESAAE